MSLQRIPHDTTKYRNNPIEMLDISKRNRIGSEYALTANTKLLITGIGENNGTTILDSTGKTVTRYGDTKISTVQSIIGGSSIYFDGTGDYLRLDDSVDWDFPGDFAIDFWLLTSQTLASAYALLVGAVSGTGSGISDIGVSISMGSGDAPVVNKLNLEFTNNGSSYAALTTSEAVASGVWTHVCACRYNGLISIYLNGVSKASTSNSLSINNTAFYLRSGWGYHPTQYFNGYLSHLRITKGQALWTANFTPPKFISDNYIGA